MYGMVNQAIKDLVVTRFGESKWEEICELSNVPPSDFVFMQYYPDKLTYDLVGAVSTKLNLAPQVVLEEFGKHWVLYTAKEGYGPIMDMFGSDFKSCLKNLNNLHSRMGMAMPNLTPPKFGFVEKAPNLFEVSYKSKRPGLCPMVVGLLKGLAQKYNVNAEISLCEATDESGERLFEIKLVG
jgi:hypothetical protein